MAQLDDFAGVNGNSLPTHNANWIALTGTASSLQITDAERARCTGAGSCGNYWDVSVNANSEVSAGLYLRTRVSSSIHYWCARGRKSGSTNHFIWLRLNILNSSSAQWQMGEAVDSTFTTIKSSSDISPNPATGDTFASVRFVPNGVGGAAWVGETKVLELNGTTEQFSITGDGYCGLRIVPGTTSSNTVGGHFDNFGITTPGGTTYNQSMSASVTDSASMAMATTFSRSMSASVSDQASISKQLALSQSMQASVTDSASMQTASVLSQSLSATISDAASLIAQFMEGAGVTPALKRWYGMARSMVLSVLASNVDKGD